ncbi:MAG: DUF4349 domain-containing protein [Patescibacteria group bacterium]|jgi:hypothetical protein
MKQRTKWILAAAAAVIVLIPIIIIAAAVVSVIGSSSSSSSVGTYRSVSDGQFALTSDNAEMAVTASAPSSSRDMMFFEEPTAGSTAAEVDQKIIKTGYLEMVVDSANEAATKISALATGMGGYTQDSSISEDESGIKYGTVTVRLPTDVFENAMTEIKKIAVSVATESSNAQDVTEEYTDLEAQLKNAQAQETEYLEILKKAESVEDILSVQSYLGNIRSQIESLQGRIKYLSNLTSYSTITTYLSEDPTINIPSKEFRPWAAIKEAAQAVVSVLQGLVITLIWLVIMGVGVLAPIALVIWLVVWVVKKIWRNRRSKK